MPDTQRDLAPSAPGGSKIELPQLTGSLAFANGPAARALLEFARVSGFGSLENLNLIGINEAQQEFVDWIVKHYAEIPQLRDLTSMTSHDWEVLNNFLVSNGFDPLFTQFDPNDLGICSIVKKAMEWTAAGTPTSIYRDADGKSYPGFKLEGDAAQVQSLQHGVFSRRIAIATKGHETIYLAMLPEEMEGPRDGAHLLQMARQMLAARARTDYGFSGAIIPMITFDQVAELNWLDGLRINPPDGTSNILASCRQHVKFYMNERGARLEAAFAGVVARGLPPAPLVIDRHFVLAVLTAPPQPRCSTCTRTTAGRRLRLVVSAKDLSGQPVGEGFCASSDHSLCHRQFPRVI
ncbi:MAG TPA: hypothetical protein VD907_03420 [Verrucomicrobiae bacterium]|nr:hypothetical protein [Verrucomicrobiae bacterium]